MTAASKIGVALVVMMVAVVLYGSMSLRHAFEVAHTHTSTTNSLINEACR